MMFLQCSGEPSTGNTCTMAGHMGWSGRFVYNSLYGVHPDLSHFDPRSEPKYSMWDSAEGLNCLCRNLLQIRGSSGHWFDSKIWCFSMSELGGMVPHWVRGQREVVSSGCKRRSVIRSTACHLLPPPPSTTTARPVAVRQIPKKIAF